MFLFPTSFGVCCLFVQTSCSEEGSIIQANNSYVSNPGFPAAYTSMESCTYNVVNQNSGNFRPTSRYYCWPIQFFNWEFVVGSIIQANGIAEFEVEGFPRPHLTVL